MSLFFKKQSVSQLSDFILQSDIFRYLLVMSGLNLKIASNQKCQNNHSCKQSYLYPYFHFRKYILFFQYCNSFSHSYKKSSSGFSPKPDFFISAYFIFNRLVTRCAHPSFTARSAFPLNIQSQSLCTLTVLPSPLEVLSLRRPSFHPEYHLRRSGNHGSPVFQPACCDVPAM